MECDNFFMLVTMIYCQMKNVDLKNVQKPKVAVFLEYSLREIIMNYSRWLIKYVHNGTQVVSNIKTALQKTFSKLIQAYVKYVDIYPGTCS